MNILRFTFKNEAIWTIAFAVVLPIVGVLSILIVWLTR